MLFYSTLIGIFQFSSLFSRTDKVALTIVEWKFEYIVQYFQGSQIPHFSIWQKWIPHGLFSALKNAFYSRKNIGMENSFLGEQISSSPGCQITNSSFGLHFGGLWKTIYSFVYQSILVVYMYWESWDTLERTHIIYTLWSYTSV